ncbi:MAG: hypothetical protein GEU87_17950 [Alphaproteobacteria bacterium]|nr:hypothetical protein [Alphaproteobacteria bacterium]
MKGLERRLVKLESRSKGTYRPLQSLSDQELDMRISAMIKRACGAQLSPQEEAALAIPVQPSRATTSMTDDELDVHLSHAIAAWLSERSETA